MRETRSEAIRHVAQCRLFRRVLRGSSASLPARVGNSLHTKISRVAPANLTAEPVFIDTDQEIERVRHPNRVRKPQQEPLVTAVANDALKRRHLVVEHDHRTNQGALARNSAAFGKR